MDIDINKIMKHAEIVDASGETYDHAKFGPLWYFNFPTMKDYPNLPSQIGEHGTKEEATQKVAARLKEIMGQ